MIEVLDGLPAHVVAVSARGRVTGEDYEKTIVPTVESKLKSNPKLNFLYHLGEDFSGFDAGALWDDAKIGLQHLNSFEKIAVVSDKDFIVHATKAFGFLMPCVVRVFKNSELEQAKLWVAGETARLPE